MTTIGAGDPSELVQAWLDADPDEETRAETTALLAGDAEELRARFSGHLSFGTAGLRGRLGAGPNRMNRVIVRLVAAALADEVASGPDPHVVVGYDARHGSATFASDTARVLLARGIRCTLLPRPLPTPVLAHSVRHLDASAGVMVTASHNPRLDNGYKVYGRGGALLTSPADTRIAEGMRTRELLTDADLAPVADVVAQTGTTEELEQLIEDYIHTVVGTLDPAGPRSALAVHTALHGVGTETATRAFAAAGFEPLITVAEQAEPDPDFPTAAFPNPEEPGTLDLLLALGDRHGADLALANDPDADRLAVAVPSSDGWRNLSGDDLGCLLADHALRTPTDDARTPLVITTITSSRLLERVAAAHGAAYVETLTGFKWIMHGRAAHPDHRLVCGYEEALGYAVNELVPDKDGISAALVIAELASALKDRGESLLDRLDELHRTHGVHITGQRAIRFESRADGQLGQALAMDALRRQPPTELAGMAVTAVVDLAEGAAGLPPTNGIVIELDGARVVIRPSGTEPKMKVYGEVVTPAGGDLDATRRATRQQLRTLLSDAVAVVTAFDRPPTTASAIAESQADAAFIAPQAGRARRDDLLTIVRCIDLTTLEGDDTGSRVRALCAQARRPDATNATVGPVAAVCVYPAFAATVAEMLAGADVQTACVAGAFPHGLSGLGVRLADIADVVERGATEVDIVLDRSAMIEGRLDDVRAALEQSRVAAGDAHLKVILEVGELDHTQIDDAARLAMEAGADFVKTSTGKAKVNATPATVWTMAHAVKAYQDASGRRVGLKIAGGVRTADDALRYVHLVREVLGDEWITPELFRFGASSLLDAVVAELDADHSPAGVDPS